MAAASPRTALDEFLDRVGGELTTDALSTDPALRAALSADLSYREHAVAGAVLSPSCTEDVAKAVGAAHAAGLAVYVRGGGMSYTSGYTPTSESSVLLDMRGMNRIVEINERDMYVVVEAGVTWKELNDALEPRGLRTPYWGPLSGRFATVGGALSQNSLFHGSGIHRTVADSVVGLEVVLGDGTVLRTGSWAHRHGVPFTRTFGPDVTGLFLGDTGAFAVKAKAALRLLARPRHTNFLSFRCETLEAMIRCKARIARLAIASECFGFDRRYNAAAAAAAGTVKEGVAALTSAARQGGLRGVAAAVQIAAAGRGVLEDVPYSLHVILDGHAQAVVDAHAAIVEEICREEGTTKMPPTIPAAVRGSPFRPARPGLVNLQGEVFLPVHAFFTTTRALDAARETEAFLAENEAELQRAGVTTRFLCAMAGTDVLLETIFDWADEIGPFRASLLEPRDRDELSTLQPAEAARRLVAQKRRELCDVYDRLGGTHLQIGQYYPYLELMEPATRELLETLKRAVDPTRTISPGNLGL